MWCSLRFYSPVLVAILVQRASALAVQGTRRSPDSSGGYNIFSLLNGTEDNEQNVRVSLLFIHHPSHLTPVHYSVFYKYHRQRAKYVFRPLDLRLWQSNQHRLNRFPSCDRYRERRLVVCSRFTNSHCPDNLFLSPRFVPPQDFVFNNTGIPVTNSYGDGETTDVVGTIGFASVQLGGYTVDYQGMS